VLSLRRAAKIVQDQATRRDKLRVTLLSDCWTGRSHDQDYEPSYATQKSTAAVLESRLLALAATVEQVSGEMMQQASAAQAAVTAAAAAEAAAARATAARLIAEGAQTAAPQAAAAQASAEAATTRVAAEQAAAAAVRYERRY
jgi:hypothetical protein